MDSWLFDFRASEVGGGLKRLEETAKWCSEQRPSTFIVSATILDKIAELAPKNNYIPFKMTALERLIFDSSFISKELTLSKYNCYFAYGVPLYARLFEFQWLHISNALVLNPLSYTLPISSRAKFLELNRRTRISMQFADAISGESIFSADEVRKYSRPSSCKVLVLPNGVDDLLINSAQKLCGKPKATEQQLALTVGTMPYKRIDRTIIAWRQYCEREGINIPLTIVGRITPDVLTFSKRIKGIDLLEQIPREQLYELMSESSIFFSSSEVENSPNAALEALLLSRKVCLSDIPAHRELIGSNAPRLSINGFPYLIVKQRNYEKYGILFKSLAAIVSEMFEVPIK